MSNIYNQTEHFHSYIKLKQPVIILQKTIVIMDPEYSLQDVVRCHLCGTPSPSLHCVNCHIHMCRDCEGVNLSNRSKKHKVVPFKNRRSTTICPRHSSNICELYCENCKFPLCVQCVPSKDHKGHEFVDIVEKLEGKKQLLQSDLKERNSFILNTKKLHPISWLKKLI